MENGRTLYKRIGYKQWRSFDHTIQKAIHLIKNSVEQGVIVESTSIVTAGKGAKRSIRDYLLDEDAIKLLIRLAQNKLNKPITIRNETIMLTLLEKYYSSVGYSFDFQKPLNKYIFDCCIDGRVIVEFDEPHHSDELEKRNDAEKERVAKAAGYSILRFDLTSDIVDMILTINSTLNLQRFPSLERDNGLLYNTIIRWADADKIVKTLPEECYLTSDGITRLCGALRKRSDAEIELHRLAILSAQIDKVKENQQGLYPVDSSSGATAVNSGKKSSTVNGQSITYVEAVNVAVRDCPSGYPDDEQTACDCYRHRTGKFDDGEFMCGQADQQREISDTVTVRAVIDDMPHVAGKGVKFRLRYLEYENDKLNCSTGPIDLADVMVSEQHFYKSVGCREAFDKWYATVSKEEWPFWKCWEAAWNQRTPEPVSVELCRIAVEQAVKEGGVIVDKNNVAKAVLDAAGVKYHED